MKKLHKKSVYCNFYTYYSNLRARQKPHVVVVNYPYEDLFLEFFEYYILTNLNENSIFWLKENMLSECKI